MKRTRQFKRPVSHVAQDFPGRTGVVTRRARLSLRPVQSGARRCRNPLPPGDKETGLKTQLNVSVWQVGSFEVPLDKSALNKI